jgi:hypothetical protein
MSRQVPPPLPYIAELSCEMVTDLADKTHPTWQPGNVRTKAEGYEPLLRSCADGSAFSVDHRSMHVIEDSLEIRRALNTQTNGGRSRRRTETVRTLPNATQELLQFLTRVDVTLKE